LQLSLRKKIADSEGFNRFVERRIAAYIRFAYKTSSWQRSGFEPMEEAVQNGEPVIVALWHQRLLMSPYLFDASKGKICTLTSSARAGRLAGNVQTLFGFETLPMSGKDRRVKMSRELLRKIRNGVSIGIAADGPNGPARVASTVPLVWARTSGCRVFTLSFSARRVMQFPTWDHMMLPAPWTKGVLMCREWDETVPRKVTDEQTETLRGSLEQALNEITDASDRATGRIAD
jgi:lysophospholipid acyltransferase (LPLAT)-like uncharacterized protein